MAIGVGLVNRIECPGVPPAGLPFSLGRDLCPVLVVLTFGIGGSFGDTNRLMAV
jgi:hypothetical protein